MNKKTLITVLQYVAFLGLGIAIIVYMSSQLSEKDKEEMIEAIKSVRYWIVLPILIGGFLSHYFRALRWKLMLKPLNIYPSTTNTTLAVLIGYIANLVLPRAGEVAKCTVLARYEKVPADKMIGTIVAERIFDLICLIVLTIFAFLLEADVIGEYAQDIMVKISEKTYVFVIVLIAMVLMVAVAIMIFRRYKETRVGKFIKGLSDGLRSILQIKNKGLFLLYTALIWGMYLALVVLGFWSMPATQHLGFAPALVVLIFGSVGMITTQGGIGAYTYLVAKILLFYNMENAIGQAFGWVSWIAQTLIVLVLGIGALVLLPIVNRNKMKDDQARVGK